MAKLVIKAILLIEDSGGEVVGLTSDGASSNRTMWNSLGVILFTQYLILMNHTFILLLIQFNMIY